MKRLEVLSYLGQIKEAREEFARVQTKFASDVDAMMNRLIHEGARNFMSAEEIGRAAGMPVKRIRAFMRSAGLSPSDSKTLLSKKAAEALANNSALLGIEPSEMDLMSPLAYLPMGSVMKRELQDRSVSQVTDVSGNLEDRLYRAIVLRFEGMGEAWTTDESGDTLARAAAEVAAREVGAE